MTKQKCAPKILPLIGSRKIKVSTESNNCPAHIAGFTSSKSMITRTQYLSLQLLGEYDIKKNLCK
jgi:hypothetical protein